MFWSILYISWSYSNLPPPPKKKFCFPKIGDLLNLHGKKDRGMENRVILFEISTHNTHMFVRTQEITHSISLRLLISAFYGPVHNLRIWLNLSIIQNMWILSISPPFLHPPHLPMDVLGTVPIFFIPFAPVVRLVIFIRIPCTIILQWRSVHDKREYNFMTSSCYLCPQYPQLVLQGLKV